jgi:hypothetical protein
MLSIRTAASLLERATSLAHARPLLDALGFSHEPLPIDAQLRTALGVDAFVERAQLLAGRGPLRVLLGHVRDSHDVRDAVRRMVLALDRHATGSAWLLCVVHPASHSVTLAVGSRASTPSGSPHIAALHVDTRHVRDSDADTVRSMVAVAHDTPLMAYARWRDILGRDALSDRFYRALDAQVQQLADTAEHPPAHRINAADRHTLALLCVSRLLFLGFLEAKGWLDHERGFLLRECTRGLERGGRLHQRWLAPLFFGTLNTPVRQRAPAAQAFGRVPFLNGGLFAYTALERQHRGVVFHDDAIVSVISELIDRYHFTAREGAVAWSEAAVDPEMLGRAFESLMAPQERRGSGTYYTPPSLVESVVDHAIDALTDGSQHPSERNARRTRIASLRVLDPACGSGAFLVRVLDVLTNMLRDAGDTRAPYVIRRDVLSSSIFGVDINPMAVWLCELRLWLAVVIDCEITDPFAVPPLPNLDHHVRVGNALSGGDFQFVPTTGRRLEQLRARYTAASGARKVHAARALDHEERTRAVAELARAIAHHRRARAALLSRLRSRDLFGERQRPSALERARLLQWRSAERDGHVSMRRLLMGGALPFRFASHFTDVGVAGGFDLVVGNPPWVRPHAVPTAERAVLKRTFHTMREPSWRAGAARSGANTGFGGQADIAAAFVERSLALTRDRGVMALLVPAKLWRTLAGGGVRRHILTHTAVHRIVDWSDASPLFDAATYPSLLVATRHLVDDTAATPLHTSVHVHAMRRSTECAFAIPQYALPMGNDRAAPWLLVPPPVRIAFDALTSAGTPLADAGFGRPMLGIKCGVNDAFLVAAREDHDDRAHVSSGERTGVIERTLLRPAMAGHVVGRSASTASIIWTHGTDGTPLRTLPPLTGRWLHQWRPQLEQRRDALHSQPWWRLFRTAAACAASPRFVWADFGQQLRSCVLDAGDPTVPLNSCYVLRMPSLEDAYAMHAWLTAPLSDAWMYVIAEPARGGWRRYLGWTVATLPVPRHWARARTVLAPLGRRIGTHDAPSPDEHQQVAARTIGVPLRRLEPLLQWRDDRWTA